MGISTIVAVIALYVNPLLIETFGWTIGLLVTALGSAISIVSTCFYGFEIERIASVKRFNFIIYIYIYFTIVIDDRLNIYLAALQERL